MLALSVLVRNLCYISNSKKQHATEKNVSIYSQRCLCFTRGK